MSAKEEYTQIIKDVYSINSFVKLCDMELVDVECGKVTLAMPIDAAKHTNLYEVAHGGSLAALADTALGMASASVGARKPPCRRCGYCCWHGNSARAQNNYYKGRNL